MVESWRSCVCWISWWPLWSPPSTLPGSCRRRQCSRRSFCRIAPVPGRRRLAETSNCATRPTRCRVCPSSPCQKSDRTVVATIGCTWICRIRFAPPTRPSDPVSRSNLNLAECAFRASSGSGTRPSRIEWVRPLSEISNGNIQGFDSHPWHFFLQKKKLDRESKSYKRSS